MTSTSDPQLAPGAERSGLLGRLRLRREEPSTPGALVPPSGPGGDVGPAALELALDQSRRLMRLLSTAADGTLHLDPARLVIVDADERARS